jgi:hypothetical protein
MKQVEPGNQILGKILICAKLHIFVWPKQPELTLVSAMFGGKEISLLKQESNSE